MKKLFLKISLFLILLVIILEIFSTVMLSGTNFFSSNKRWYEIYKIDQRSRTNLHSDTVILGASVAHQLFHPEQAQNYLATHAHVTLAGNYILASNLIKNNPDLKTIVFVFHPGGFGGVFEKAGVYAGFVKPMFNYHNYEYFDTLLINKMARKPLSFLSIFNFYKILPLDDVNFNAGEKRKRFEISDFSLIYLKKLKQLCNSHQIELILASPPLSDIYMDYASLNILKSNVQKYQLEEIFDGYFENIVFLPDECFKDGNHFKGRYLKRNLSDVRKMMKQLK